MTGTYNNFNHAQFFNLDISDALHSKMVFQCSSNYDFERLSMFVEKKLKMIVSNVKA